MTVTSQGSTDPVRVSPAQSEMADELLPVNSSTNPDPASADGEEHEIENLPPKTWVTLGLFAVFVIAFGTCASTYLFR